MSLSNQQLKVSFERLSLKLELSEKARTEMRQELSDSYDYCEMVMDMNNKLHTILEINNIKLDYEGELH